MDSRRWASGTSGTAIAQVRMGSRDERRVADNANRSDMHKAVVLLSGGMDSCVCAAIARERHGAANVALLHAGYGQRTQERERQAFEGIADFYGVSQSQRLVVQLEHFRAIGGSALTDTKIAV